jgi:hypothetical protein
VTVEGADAGAAREVVLPSRLRVHAQFGHVHPPVVIAGKEALLCTQHVYGRAPSCGRVSESHNRRLAQVVRSVSLRAERAYVMLR